MYRCKSIIPHHNISGIPSVILKLRKFPKDACKLRFVNIGRKIYSSFDVYNVHVCILDMDADFKEKLQFRIT